MWYTHHNYKDHLYRGKNIRIVDLDGVALCGRIVDGATETVVFTYDGHNFS